MLRKQSSKSTHISNSLYNAIADGASAYIRTEPTMQKDASIVAEIETRKPLELAKPFLKLCQNFGGGIYQDDSGIVWKVATDTDGVPWLERDDELTLENDIVKDLLG